MYVLPIIILDNFVDVNTQSMNLCVFSTFKSSSLCSCPKGKKPLHRVLVFKSI